MKNRTLYFLSFALFVMFGVSGVLAQTTGTISGTVKDVSGAAIPDATVMAKDIATGTIRTATTNAVGEYAFPALDPGQYDLEVKSVAFAPLLQHVTLNVTERIAVDAVLRVTATQQEIVVTGDAPILQTEANTLGRVVDSPTIKDLPLATRNFTQILTLSPGTSAPLNDATALGRGTTNISANGARTGSNAFYIDGIDAVDIHVNSASNNAFASNGVVIPSPDSIQEFKVQTGLYDAEAGRSGGANVALVTRSGTDRFHGSVFEFFRNDDLNANAFFVKQVANIRPELKQNQFGGTIGGPIVRNKAFFFFAYQGTRQVNGVSGTSNLTLPPIPQVRTATTLGAIFGQTTTVGTTTTYLYPTYKGGTQVALNGSNINPVALALLNLKLPNGTFAIPSPQTNSTTGVNYSVSVPSTFDEDQYVGGLDYQLRTNDHFAFKTIIAQQPQFNSLQVNVPGFGTTQQFSSRLYSLTETHVFSSNVVNEARFGANRSLGTTGFQTQFPLSAIGMQKFNSVDFPYIPSIGVTSAFTIGYGVNTDQATFSTTYQYFDNLSYTRGKHQMQFGGEARRYQDNYFSNNRQAGSLTSQRMSDFLLGLSGNSVASGGNGSGYSNLYTSSVASGVVQRNDRIGDYAFFAGDSWHALPNLTVNLGLRWEYIGLPVDKGGRDGAFYLRNYVAPAPGQFTSAGFVLAGNTTHPIPGLPLVSNTLTDHVSHLDFGPRIGLAFQANRRVNIRAGYGLTTDRVSNQLGLLESLSAPNYIKTDLTGTANINSTFQVPFPTLPTRSQFPITPTIYGGPFTNANPQLALNTIDPKFRTPYVQQYGLNVQVETSKNTVVELGYVGSRGIALPVETLPDQAILASPSAPINGITTNTAANAQSRVPYVGFSSTGFIYLQTIDASNYNSGQVSLTKRMSHGLQFLAAYTYSKSLDDESAPTDGTTFATRDGDQTNPAAQYGPSSYDRTHRIVVSGHYTIPAFGFGLNDTTFGKKFFTGWEFSAVGVAQSGLPFSVTDSGGGSLYAGGSSRAQYAPGATAASAKLNGPVESRLQMYFNTAAFTTVPQAPASVTNVASGTTGTLYGNTGRGILRGPGQSNLDMSFIKRTPIHENINFEFRAEAFNVLNHPSFDSPSSAVSSPTTYGTIHATVGNPRILQLAAKVSF